MSLSTTRTVDGPAPVLAFRGTRALFLETMLVAAAALLPALFHLLHAPVRWMVPMHWPVLMAGLVYGWRGGATAGLLAPLVSTALTGYPLVGMLPAITAEHLFYGLGAGVFRESLRWGNRRALAAALIAGRLVFVLVAGLTVVGARELMPYLQVALLPGLPAAAAQIIFLPALASRWVRREVE